MGSRKRWVTYAATALILLVGVSLLYWGTPTQRSEAFSQLCRANIHSLYFVLEQYADAHGGRLPSGAGESWTKEAKDWLRSHGPLRCPLDRAKGDELYTSYLLVPEAAGRPIDSMRDKVILRENARRHSGVGYELYGDGHVPPGTEESR